MGKSLYSLMLSDEVVDAIDKMAHRQNMTRSAMVNKILAEQARVSTPEQRINDIFSYIENFFNNEGCIVPQIMTNQQTMALKSSLDYKYRPTVRYEVELERNAENSIGNISVIFRTQSETLLSEMIAFFRYWKLLEDEYLPGLKGEKTNSVEYGLYDNKFVRSISLVKNKNYTTDSIAECISSYINMFDCIMKDYLSGNISSQEIERKYVGYLEKGVGIL